MEALILTCGTGGGHNTAAEAIAEELKDRGHQVRLMNPYDLAGRKTASTIDQLYIKLVQNCPMLFGLLYQLGNLYRRLPVHSPVYWLNRKMSGALEGYLDEHPADVIVMTHIFAGQIIAQMKMDESKRPMTVLVATDYTCIPFTEETDCDAYVIPTKALIEEFASYGIPREKILPLGIPVKKEMQNQPSKQEARKQLRWAQDDQYIVLCGGSIGAGKIRKAQKRLEGYLKKNPKAHLVVICGKNEKLYRRMNQEHEQKKQTIIMRQTHKMALLMKACDLFITKPGGLTSTEAAVIGTNLVEMSPIPGCESRNLSYFVSRRMARKLTGFGAELDDILASLEDLEIEQEIAAAQKAQINASALKEICDHIEGQVCTKKEIKFKKVLTAGKKPDNIYQVLSNSC